MSDGGQTTLAALRQRIARIEKAESSQRTSAASFTLGLSAVDTRLRGGLKRGALHEMLCARQAHASAAAGFTLALAARAAGKRRKIIWIRQRFLETEIGALSARGILELGVNPDTLIVASLPSPLAVLQAANDAVRCKGLGALIVDLWRDPKAFDLTASRRLSHISDDSGVTCFLLRIRGEPFPTAAMTRWLVKPARSTPLKANAPGHPVFDVTLLRHRLGVASFSWRVEWNRDQRLFRETAPLSRSVVSVSSDRKATEIGGIEELRNTG